MIKDNNDFSVVKRTITVDMSKIFISFIILTNNHVPANVSLTDASVSWTTLLMSGCKNPFLRTCKQN